MEVLISDKSMWDYWKKLFGEIVDSARVKRKSISREIRVMMRAKSYFPLKPKAGLGEGVITDQQ